MRHSLQLKLLAAFMLVITVTLGTVLWGISAFIKGQILTNKQHELLQKGTELAQAVQAFQEEAGSIDRLGDYLTNADQYLDARIWVLDKNRQILAISGRHLTGNGPKGTGNHSPMGGGPGMGLSPMGGMRSLFDKLDPVYNGQVLTTTMEQPYYGEKMLVVAVPIKNTDGSVLGAVVLNTPVTGINAFMQRIYYYVAAGGIAALLLALLVVNLLTRTIVRPLRAMQQAAGAMATGDYTTRVDVQSRDEVGELGNAFNSLAEDLANYMAELEKTERLRRDFVANVSHELRTPLTIMRSYTEALIDGTVVDPVQTGKYLVTIQEETKRLERLVTDLLVLSRLQSETATWQVELIPLPEIADSVIHMVQPAAMEKNITLYLETENNVPNILGSGDHLIQLLLIFLDNALKHTPTGGRIRVSVQSKADGILLTVADTGIGIPAEDLPYVWDRFFKVDKSHSRTESGAGLGLAIAKQIIDRHLATATIITEPGFGTTFTILFPVE